MERQVFYYGTKIKKKKQRKAGGRGWGGVGWGSEIRAKEREERYTRYNYESRIPSDILIPTKPHHLISH